MSEMAGQAQEKAGQAAQRARTQAVTSLGQALGRARVGVDQQSVVAGERVNTVAQRARLIGAELHRMGEHTPARLAEQGAARAQQLGDWLKQLDADELTGYGRRVQPGRAVTAVEGFARRRPLLALATGATLGFLPARLLKMSSGRRQAAGGAALGGQGDLSSPGLEASAAPMPPLDQPVGMGTGDEVGAVGSAPTIEEPTIIRRERISPDVDEFGTGR